MPPHTSRHTRQLPLSDVQIDDDFWNPRLETNREVTLAHQYEQLDQSGCLENFRRVAAGKRNGFDGPMFIDSDAYKWLEAASYVLSGDGENDELRNRVTDVIDLIAETQAEDGYLHTYFMLEEPNGRWENLNRMHELYCAGHLIEAAVAHHRALGDDSLLDVAVSFADQIDRQFGPAEQDGVPGHEEIELALVKLYRATGTRRYLRLASYFIDARGNAPSRLERELEQIDAIAGSTFIHHGQLSADRSREQFLTDEGEYDGRYAQDHLPVRQQDTVEGHAVRAMYLFTGVTSLLLEEYDEELWDAMNRLWENMTTRRMYVTGGIGSTATHEGFTEDYDLPNETAYAETCAAVGSIFWNRRLFELTGDAQYHDLVERTLYNGFLASISTEGGRYFYVNPLESAGDHHRKEWFYVACCPPNAARLLASLERYIYATTPSENVLYVTQFIGSTVHTEFDGNSVSIIQQSAFPWNPEVSFKFTHQGTVALDFRVRIPEWARSVDVRVNGDATTPSQSNGYLNLDRTWQTGDEVSVSFSAAVEALQAHPNVRHDTGRVALRRGPLIYCLEDADHSVPVQNIELHSLDSFEAVSDHDTVDRMTVLRGTGSVPETGTWDETLYRPDAAIERVDTAVVAVPYFAWDNREPGSMRVWIPMA
ncbi:glycoside hydrolase family 127 protein [Haloferax sp. DFSO52]|uniref:glycoside hydrolase family 127 protein n=1 Tax=Haloferax sp. DFSO52 TaxID=3388505 RepID=UPI003A8C4219